MCLFSPGVFQPREDPENIEMSLKLLLVGCRFWMLSWVLVGSQSE